MSDLELIKYYARQWDRYTTGAGYVHKLFNYLNKHWVKREKDEGRKDVYSVYTVGSYGSGVLTVACTRCLEEEFFPLHSEVRDRTV